MPSTSTDIPILQLNKEDISDMLRFISQHEQLLKEYGAIKIKPAFDCELGLKRQSKDIALCSISKKILTKSKNNCFYSVQDVAFVDEFTGRSLLVKNEDEFWSSLSSVNEKQRQLDISLLSNQSFFCKKSPRSKFNLRSVPARSLLKIGGKTIIDQCLPCLKRAHGSGAIFPLSCTQDHLFSIDYHHKGGTHQWYIIPADERNTLQLLLDQQNSSLCLDHGQIFINPNILDKHHIRYHRITQAPNEFIVLAAGTLAQSFTLYASWSESIVFALPSWIEEGHAKFSNSLCHCDVLQDSLSNSINIALFRPTLIQRYIKSHLNTTINKESNQSTDSNDMDMVTVLIPQSLQVNSTHDEITVPTNMRLIIARQQIMSPHQSSPISFTTSFVSSNLSEDDSKKSHDDDDNAQNYFELLQHDTSVDSFDQVAADISLLESILAEELSELDTKTNQSDENITILTNNPQTLTDECNADNFFLPYEELMDLLPAIVYSMESIHTEVDRCIDTVMNDITTVIRVLIKEESIRKYSRLNLNYLGAWNSSSRLSFDSETTTVSKYSHVKKNQACVSAMENHKTLFVSKLKHDVTQKDLRDYFQGSIKVTIKQYRSTPHLRYAFIQHRSSRAAQSNFQRRVDYDMFGSACTIEYATSYLSRPHNNRHIDSKKIMVRRIPQNVSADDLRHLFGNCHITKYCPAVIISTLSTTIIKKHSCTVLLGYAHISFDDEEQGTEIIKHANQYQIKGQSLVIGLYRH